MVWTGTHGLLQLADSNGNLVLPLILLAWVLTICSFSTHSIQTSRLTSTWTTRAIRRFRCPSDKNLQISKRSILVSGFSGKWSLTEKASGESQCWAQTIHTRLRLHLALRLHKRCPGSGDGEPSFISGFISTPPSPALWTQWRWRRGLWPPALLRISQQLFKSSRGESTLQEGFSYEMKINPLTWQNKMVDQ